MHNYSSSPPVPIVGRILPEASIIYCLLCSSSWFVLFLPGVCWFPFIVGGMHLHGSFVLTSFLFGDSASSAQCYLLNLSVNFSFLAWLTNSVEPAQYWSAQDNDLNFLKENCKSRRLFRFEDHFRRWGLWKFVQDFSRWIWQHTLVFWWAISQMFIECLRRYTEIDKLAARL